MTDEPGLLAIGLVTACHNKDFNSMAAMLGELRMMDIGPVVSSMCGMASAMLDYLSVYMEIESDVLLHKFGIETALG